MFRFHGWLWGKEFWFLWFTFVERGTFMVSKASLGREQGWEAGGQEKVKGKLLLLRLLLGLHFGVLFPEPQQFKELRKISLWEEEPCLNHSFVFYFNCFLSLDLAIKALHYKSLLYWDVINIQPTILMCIIQRRVLGCSQSCVRIITIWFQNIFITPQRNPVFCSPSLLTSSKKPLIYFLSVWVCLFWIFPMNEITQYVDFCVWLFSLRSEKL